MNGDIKETINELNKAFNEFKMLNDAKLEGLQNNKNDLYIDRKLEKLNTEISRLDNKIIDISLKRPDLAIETDCYNNKDGGTELKNYMLTGELLAKKSSEFAMESSNGLVAPQDIVNNINSELEGRSVIRRLAKKYKTSSNHIDIIQNTYAPSAGWTDEQRELDDEKDSGQESSFEIAKIQIPVHEIFSKPKATKYVLEDSMINMEDWLISSVVSQMSAIENKAFLYGDGKYKPTGILKYDSITGNLDHNETGFNLNALKTFQEFKVNMSENTSDFALNLSNALIDAMCAMRPEYLSKAVWLMPRSVLAEIRKLKEPSNDRYIWQPSSNDQSKSTLLGFPVEICDDLFGIKQGSKSLLFGNIYETYTIVDRDDITILRDPFSAKPFVEFYITKRVGGDVVNFSSLKIVSFGK